MKPGYKTTEFWLGLVAIILPYLNDALGLHIPVDVVMTTLGLVATYVVGRTWVKGKIAQNTSFTKFTGAPKEVTTSSVLAGTPTSPVEQSVV